MRESKIEKHFRDEVKKLGGVAYKFTSPGRRKVLDRLVLFPHALVYFVELKATTKTPDDGQLREMRRLRALGFSACSINSIDKVNDFIEEVRACLSLF